MANKTIGQGLTRGIQEVPQHLDARTQSFLSDLRENVLALRAQQTAPSIPTNLHVTPISFGNILQWTRPVNADFSEVLWNTTPNPATANVVSVGDAAQYTDNIGQANVTRYYWVRAGKNNGVRSAVTSPIAGKSLASGTAVAPPKAPPAYQMGNRNQAATGGQGPGNTIYQGGGRRSS
jgi:hypothetical protein